MNTFTACRTFARQPSVMIKAAMALSGVGLALWLTLHMAGNLLWLLRPSVMDSYGSMLHGSGVLWPVRLLLVGGLVVHIAGAVLTTRRAHAARPTHYRRLRSSASGLASRSMRWTGVAMLGFLLYHVGTVYGMVAMHLGHGLASALVSLGMISAKHEARLRKTMRLWDCIVTVGFLLPPVISWAQHLLA